jgi:glucosamine--fructose-6-phosphate aminotransferase (isomerizing)
MCGIIGYVGRQQVLPILIDGLKRMEYRGYDSSGFAIMSPEGSQAEKYAGKIAPLERSLWFTMASSKTSRHCASGWCVRGM